MPAVRMHQANQMRTHVGDIEQCLLSVHDHVYDVRCVGDFPRNTKLYRSVIDTANNDNATVGRARH